VPGDVIFDNGGDTRLKGSFSAGQGEEALIIFKDRVRAGKQHGDLRFYSHDSTPFGDLPQIFSYDQVYTWS
jgi:hypothetical protein